MSACNKCDKKYDSNDTLYNHKLTHTGKGPSRKSTVLHKYTQGNHSVEMQNYVQHADPMQKTHGKVLKVTLKRQTAIKLIDIPDDNDAQVMMYLHEV
ncbi:hypothetical protein AAVH_20910 [Aphelenchoides avenae]|nr:hypothetical protein AAVH_20910 [Aphelenchus avenae]